MTDPSVPARRRGVVLPSGGRDERIVRLARRLSLDYVAEGLHRVRSEEVPLVLIAGAVHEILCVCTEWRHQLIAAPVIVAVEATSRERALIIRAGADDVVGWDISRAELRARAAAIGNRSATAPTPAERPTARSAAVRSAGRPLGRAERKLLAYLLTHSNRLISQAELLAEVFGGAHADTSLVRVHMCWLRRAHPAIRHAIETVRGVGYVMRPEVLRSDEGITLLALVDRNDRTPGVLP